MLAEAKRRHELERAHATDEGPDAEKHALCRLRQCHPEGVEGECAYLAIFLDTVSSLWEDECEMRRRAKWSPMLWSQVSRGEQANEPENISGMSTHNHVFYRPNAVAS